MHLPGGYMIERATDGVAVLAVFSWISPGFHDWLSSFSDIFTLLMPVLGSIWLAIQIGGAIRKNWACIRRWPRKLSSLWSNANG